MSATLTAQKRALENGKESRRVAKEAAPQPTPTPNEPKASEPANEPEAKKQEWRIGPPKKVQIEKAKELAAQGHTVEEIALAIGRTKESVEGILEKTAAVVVPKDSLTYNFPLRKGAFQASFTVPNDFSQQDYNRLCAFLSALVEA